MSELQLPHKLTINQRKSLTVDAVAEVLSFDDTAVVLRTELGILEIRGQELALKALTPEGGQLAISGQICGLDYQEPREVSGLFRRFLK